MDYAYKRVGTKGFSDTIEAVERSVSAHGFIVQEFHDIRARLAAKGFPIRDLAIFEVAPAEEADGGANSEALSLIMPCRINVYEEGEHVVVAALRPSVFSAVFPEHELDELAQQIERVVVSLVDDAVA